MKHLQYLVMVALLLLAACGQIQAPEAAPNEETQLETTATNADIAGTVYYAGARWAGAEIHLYRWNGSAWDYLGKKATTNSRSNYTLDNALTGYHYLVHAARYLGHCYTTGQASYSNSSAFWWHTQAKRTDVHLIYIQKY